MSSWETPEYLRGEIDKLINKVQFIEAQLRSDRENIALLWEVIEKMSKLLEKRGI